LARGNGGAGREVRVVQTVGPRVVRRMILVALRGELLPDSLRVWAPVASGILGI